MASILDHCNGASREEIPAGAVLLREGDTSGRLYVLAQGTLEVLRGETAVATVGEPGAVFGEMSVLLKRPHTATVRATTPASVYVFEDAESFLKSHSEIAFILARVLAERLNGATTYLVDLKRQFEGTTSHFGMVSEVLESLLHQQSEEFTPGSDLTTDPRL
jgi:CRP/FNR family transcriptional regulator, cyclic AMP receptor protein